MEEQPTSDGVREALNRYVEERSLSGGEHASMEELQELATDCLEQERAESLREHLAMCPECADKMLFVAPEEGGQGDAESEPGLTPGELERDLARLTSDLRLEGHGAAAGPEATVVDLMAERNQWSDLGRYRLQRNALAAAASLLLVISVTLVMWPRDRAEPRGDVTLAQVMPTGGVSRGSEEGLLPVGLPATLVLITNQVYDLPRFDAVIEPLEPAEGAQPISVALAPRSAGSFILFLPAGSVPAGEHRVLLRGHGMDGAEVLEEYEIEVVGAGDAEPGPGE